MSENMHVLLRIFAVWVTVMVVTLCPVLVWEAHKINVRLKVLETQEAAVGPTGLEHFHDEETEDQRALDQTCAILYNGFRIDLLRGEHLNDLLAEMFEDICDMTVPTQSARGYF